MTANSTATELNSKPSEPDGKAAEASIAADDEKAEDSQVKTVTRYDE